MTLVLAGVDEAGLGPTIGPLATGSAALAVPDSWQPDSPWQGLAGAVAAKWSRRKGTTTVADSKELYKSGGMAALELAIGAFAGARHDAPRPVPAMREDENEPSRHPCYSRTLAPFPLHCEAAALTKATDTLSAALARAGAAAIHLEIALLDEPALNRRFAAGLNKNQALLMETGSHLARLEEKFRDYRAIVVVDKQGGRNDYLPFLADLFPGTWIDCLEQGAAVSSYRLRRRGGDMEIRFQAKADRSSFPTALASMAAKYARERAMAELNAWFCERLPDLSPTAGYPEDARRWLAEVRAHKRDDLGLERVIRMR